MGGPAHLARGLLGRHGSHKPYPGRAWVYKVARGPARPGPPTWSGQCRPGLNRPGQDGPGPGRAGPPVWPSIWRGDCRGVMVAGLEVTTRCLVFVCQSNGGEGAAACCRRGAAPGVLSRRGGAVWRRGDADLHQGRAGGGRSPWFARAKGKGGRAGASA
jgi:hypothetical protein